MKHRASPAQTHLEHSRSLAFLLNLNLTMTLDSLQTNWPGIFKKVAAHE